MAFYYVKSGGTATGDGGRYTTEKNNNSWATEFSATSEYYASIEDALAATTAPVNGDFVYISSASTFSKGTSVTLAISPVPSSPVQIFSVNDNAVQQYLAGASEDTGGANLDYALSSNAMKVEFNGVTVAASDDITMTGTNSEFRFNDCTLSLEGSSDRVSTLTDGSAIVLNNTAIVSETGTTNLLVFVANGGLFKMFGGSTSATSGSLNDFVAEGFTAGGGMVEVVGADLSAHGSGTFLLGRVGSAVTADDLIDVRFHGCRLNASVGFVEEEFASGNHYFLATNCSSSSGAAEYQFFQRTWAGDVEDQDDTGIHRGESTAYPGGTKVSLNATTNASCGISRPLVFDCLTRFSELSSASSDTIRIYFASTATLTDTEVWAEVSYPDGTTKNLYNFLSNRASDVLGAGTTHTTDSGSTWKNGGTDLVGYNEYYMDLDTSSDAGADSVPTIKIYVAKASTTVYFDTTVDLV